eukprot:261383_1
MDKKIPLIVMILLVVIVIVVCCLCFMCYKLLSCRNPTHQDTKIRSHPPEDHHEDSSDISHSESPVITIKSPKYKTDRAFTNSSPHQIVPSDSDIQTPMPPIHTDMYQYTTNTHVTTQHPNGTATHTNDLAIPPVIPNPASAVMTGGMIHQSPSTIFITKHQSPSTKLLNTTSRVPGLDTPSFGRLSSTPGTGVLDDMDLNSQFAIRSSVVAVDGSVCHGTYASEGMAAAWTRDHGQSESIKFAKYKKNSMHASSSGSAKRGKFRVPGRQAGRSVVVDHMEEVLDYEMAKIDEDGVYVHDKEDKEDTESSSNDNELNDLMEEEMAAEFSEFGCSEAVTRGDTDVQLGQD